MLRSVVDMSGESQELTNLLQFNAEYILGIAIKFGLLTDPTRKAAIVALWQKGISTPLMKNKIGTVFPDNGFRAGCWNLVEEKIARTFRLNDLSSFPSRNREEGKFAGAIAISVGEVVWGFGISGFTELEDEAMAIVSAIYTLAVPIEDERIQKILKLSKNYALTERLFKIVSNKDGGYYADVIRR